MVAAVGEGREWKWTVDQNIEENIFFKKALKVTSHDKNTNLTVFLEKKKKTYFFPNIILNMCFTDKGHYESKTFYRRKHFL